MVAPSFNKFLAGWVMYKPSLVAAASKLMLDGERAGLTPEQMIELLEAGCSRVARGDRRATPMRQQHLLRWRKEIDVG